MTGSTIRRVEVWDLRFPLPSGAGSDARHTDPVYSLAVCVLETHDGLRGTGITLTLGAGNDLVAAAAGHLADGLVSADVESIVRGLGAWWSDRADHAQLRWLGPHKGVVHLALASVCGAVVDAWSRHRERPLWQLLLEAEPDRIGAMLDLRSVADELDPERTAELVGAPLAPADIDRVAAAGHAAYDTSVGWLGYTQEQLVDNALAAVEAGYGAVKLKVGSSRLADDVARIGAVREAVGPDRLVMVDANQCYDVRAACEAGRAFAELGVHWFEEPVHPDDVYGYRAVVDAIAPTLVAGGEHLPNQVAFKAFLQAGALGVAQPDAVRLGGLPEFLAVSLLCAARGVPVAPHAGDMGQLHQHLVPLLHARLGCEPVPLEMIPHLRPHFAEPASIVDGRYVLPSAPGASTALTAEAYARGTRVAVVGR